MASVPRDSNSKNSHEVKIEEAHDQVSDLHEYNLSRWRFVGLLGLVILNVIGGMNWPWFGSISAQTAQDFNISIAEVNWLGNVVNLAFLPSSLATPFLCRRYGIRGCCFGAAACYVVASWVRYAGTAKHLSPGGAYALLFLGQLIGGIAQPVFQVLGPKYSEAWFNFNGRTTATMIIAIANPVGTAVGELIPSLCGGTRTSVLVLGIISTAAFPAAFLIYSKPPTPPTFSGSLPSPPPLSTLRSLLNYSHPGDKKLSFRTRLDFFIVTFAFGSLVAASNAFSLLTAQILSPFGYSPTESGILAAVFFLVGLLAAFVTAPLLDRVFTRHITITIKVATPLLALGWLSLVWAVRPHNLAALYVVLSIMGILSLTLLPLSLELACELSQDAETSSAILWATANLAGVVFVLVGDALTAGADASPPFNLRRASIFTGVTVCAAGLFVVMGFRGLGKTRRELDAAKKREQTETSVAEVSSEATEP